MSPGRAEAHAEDARSALTRRLARSYLRPDIAPSHRACAVHSRESTSVPSRLSSAAPPLSAEPTGLNSPTPVSGEPGFFRPRLERQGRRPDRAPAGNCATRCGARHRPGGRPSRPSLLARRSSSYRRGLWPTTIPRPLWSLNSPRFPLRGNPATSSWRSFRLASGARRDRPRAALVTMNLIAGWIVACTGVRDMPVLADLGEVVVTVGHVVSPPELRQCGPRLCSGLGVGAKIDSVFC